MPSRRWGDSKNDAGFLAGEGFFEGAATLAAFDRQEAAEEEFGGGQAAADEGGDRGGRAGNDFVGHAGVPDFVEQALTGIADERHAGVGNEGHAAAVAQFGQQLLGASGLVVLVQAEQRFPDAVVLEEGERVPGVLAGDDVDGGEDAVGAERQVGEIADRSADQIEGARAWPIGGPGPCGRAAAAARSCCCGGCRGCRGRWTPRTGRGCLRTAG